MANFKSSVLMGGGGIKSVQRGISNSTYVSGGGTNMFVNINSVDPAKSVLIITPFSFDSGLWSQNVVLNSATQILVSTTRATYDYNGNFTSYVTCAFSWQVIEFV